MTDVRGRVVVITGASRGLGAGMAREMAEAGVKLGLCARGRASPLAGALYESVDVTDARAVASFAEHVASELGDIDLWINNAGVLEPVRFVRDLETQALMDHLAVNVGGVLNGTRSYLRHVRSRAPSSQASAVLFNVSSGAAQKSYAGWAAYCGGKAAVDRLTECVALEEPGVRAYALSPGVIDTDMQRLIRGLTPERFPAQEKFLELARTGAFNSPAYVAREVLRIAFDPAALPSPVVVRLGQERPR
jgi:NAD(P)-dependent dehydrogenase (short-subunit alcohol dehydrogenase family)